MRPAKLILEVRIQKLGHVNKKKRTKKNFSNIVTNYIPLGRCNVTANVAIFLECVLRAESVIAGTIFGYITFILSIPTDKTALSQLLKKVN